MPRVIIFCILFISFLIYSGIVYTAGTGNTIRFNNAASAEIVHGKQLYQRYNCTACHQLYGLGGYLGPDLTTAWSDPGRGEPLIRAMLSSGSKRMPDFRLTKDEITALTRFLQYVDSTATTYK